MLPFSLWVYLSQVPTFTPLPSPPRMLGEAVGGLPWHGGGWPRWAGQWSAWLCCPSPYLACTATKHQPT